MATGSKLYDRFYRRRLSDYQMGQFNIPTPQPGQEGVIKPFKDTHNFTPGCCKRCEKSFDITFEKIEPCNFHTVFSKVYRGNHMPYQCCGGRYGSVGCRSAPSHVYKGNVFTDLVGFRKTTQGQPKEGGDYGVYVIDTESVHTKKGLEVCRVTVLDTDCQTVYETFCLPTTEIIDYNTIWSGITKSDLDGVTKTFSEMQDDLLELFNDQSVLVGHCISSDLIAVKLIHPVLVETQALYPHSRGLPFRRGLKELAENVLGRKIQTGDGHDSKVDAEVTMKLALRKV